MKDRTEKSSLIKKFAMVAVGGLQLGVICLYGMASMHSQNSLREQERIINEIRRVADYDSNGKVTEDEIKRYIYNCKEISSPIDSLGSK